MNQEIPQQTFADVHADYAQQHDAHPDLLRVMQNLAESVKEDVQVLEDYADAHREGGDRHDIAPEHHQEHLYRAQIIDPDIGKRSSEEQDLIGEVLEIGDTAIKRGFFGTGMDANSVASTDVEHFVRPEKLSDITDLLRSIDTVTDPSDTMAIYNPIISREVMPRAELFSTADFSLNEFEEFIAEFKRVNTTPDGHQAWHPTFLKVIPKSLMQEAYANGDDSELKAYVTQLSRKDAYMADHQTAAGLLRTVYEVDGLLDLIDLKEVSGDENIANLVESEQFTYIVESEFAERLYKDPPLTNAEMADWADTYLRKLHSLPTEIADDWMFASRSRLSDPTSGKIYGRALHESLINLRSTVDSVGVAGMQSLRDKAGIVNFDYYGIDQLRTMLGVVNGDEQVIQHLRSGDVTVVLTDALGDHNGAMKSNADIFATKSGRTLFMEITRKSQPYRHMALLNKHDIKPSSIVIAAHGEPGRFTFGEAHGVGNNDSLQSTAHNSVIQEARGFSRLVSEYMQDSKGIDDAASALGRRRIILASCSQAAETERGLWNPDGFRVIAAPSMAQSMAETANHPGLDVYGPAKPAGFAVEGDEMTMTTGDIDETGRYIAQPQPLDVSNFSINNNGTLVRREIPALELTRKA